MAISDYIRKEKGQKSIKLPKLIARKKKAQRNQKEILGCTTRKAIFVGQI